MTALLTRPLPFTVTSSSSEATAPAINAADDRPGKVWRTAATNGFVVIDLGTGASYDTVAIIGSSLVATNTVRVRTGTTNTGIGASDRTVAAIVGTRPQSFTGKTIIQLGATRTERYMRIDLTAPSGSEVQRIVVGPSLTTVGIDYDADQAILDTSEVNSNLGYDMIQEGMKKVRWKFAMSMVPETEWRANWVGFLAQVGKTKPILFVPFLEDLSSHQSDAVFGRIRNDVSGKIPGMIYRTVEMTIEGLSI